MNRKKKVTVIIISILIILILVLAISFAFFSTQLNGTDQIVKVGTLDLVLDETSEGISLDNAIGLSDDKGMSLTPSTFKLINNGSKALDYTIYLDDNTIEETDTRIDDKYLKYNLVKNGESSGATLLTKIGSNPNRILDSGTIEGKGTNEYSLNLWITDEVDGNYSGQVFSGKLRVEVSQERPTASEILIVKANPEELDYNSATNDEKKEMWTFTHPETEQTESLIDYRYIGADPNNYVEFNNEIWRIIGVFTVDDGTGKMEERLKIIRGEPITKSGYTYAWNNGYSYDTTVSQHEYSWANASLNHLLNEGYESESVNGSYYWNRTGGICYASGQYGEIINTESCSFTDTGLLDEAKEMIDNTTWYLGGIDWNHSSTTNVNAAYAYSKERGTDAYSDNIETSWVGKVGLMYLSDYGYSTSGINSTMDRNSCLESKFPNYSSDSNIDCYSSSWLTGEKSQFTITQSSIYGEIFFIDRFSCVENFHYGYMNANLTPTVYLKSSIKITDGDGSSSNPYVLKL